MKCLADLGAEPVSNFLKRVDLNLQVVADGINIPGSFWGEPEAGLIKNTLYASLKTPMHSILHEAGHFICMTSERRKTLHTNAIGKTKGEFVEENAVCYLQVLMANELNGLSREIIMQDMDAWGYSFRLGSTQAWFEQDSKDAIDWLLEHKLINSNKEFLFVLRE